MKISEKGILEIASHEGVVLSPYKDCVGVWTVGIGHVLLGKEKKDLQKQFSWSEVLALFHKDLEKVQERVRNAFRIPLSQEQFDAAVSFDFNTGAIHRASWVRHFHDGAMEKAEKSFLLWRKPPEVLPRRKKELELFFRKKYSGNGDVMVWSVAENGRLDRRKAKRCAFPEISFPKTTDPSEVPDTRFLPPFRPKMDPVVLWKLRNSFTFLLPIERREDPILLLMIRGYFANSEGSLGKNRNACYDDALFLLHPTGVAAFNANADPGKYRKGIASIKAPQALRYRPGLHGYSRPEGPYPAFRQDAPCVVLRHGVGEDTGMFFVNLHRGGEKQVLSAGCLTLPPHQWEEFYALLHGLLEQEKQENFYLLLVEKNREQILAAHTQDTQEAGFSSAKSDAQIRHPHLLSSQKTSCIAKLLIAGFAFFQRCRTKQEEQK